MKYVILIVLAASFVGFLYRRKEYGPTELRVIASVYLILAVGAVFGVRT